MRAFTRLTLASCGLLMVACHTSLSSKPGVGVSGPKELVLRYELQVPPGRARVLFQQGAQVSAKDRYESHCEFEVSAVSAEGQPVAPDSFVVTRVMRRIVADEDSGFPPRLDVFASQDVFHETHLWLSSARQPGVRKLICRSWNQSLGRGRHLSAPQIQSVLGETFVLR